MINKKPLLPLVLWAIASFLLCMVLWVLWPMKAASWGISYSLVSSIGLSVMLVMVWAYALSVSYHHRVIWRSLQSDGSLPVFDGVMTQWGKALEFLKKQYGFRQMRALRRCPWYVLLGAPGSGKTSLLANASLVLESANQQSIRPVEPTESINFWVGDRVLLADVSGEWCWGDADSSAYHMWKNVLQRWRFFRAKNAYLGGIIVLDCSKIHSHDKEAWRDYVGQLSRQCQCVRSVFPHIQFTIVLSKADSLLGFEAFFSLLSAQERQQLCGVHLDTSKEQKAFESMTLALKSLLHRIDLLTVGRLHYEQNILNRDLLRAFPQRLGMFIDELIPLLEMLPGSVQRSISGIYLTSAEQSDAHEEDLDIVSSSQDLMHQTRAGSRPYFVKELFAELLKPEAHHRGAAVRWHWTIYHLLIGSAVIAGGLFWLHRGFVETRVAIENAKTALNEPLLAVGSEPDWLLRLNTLVRAQEVLSDHHLLRYRWLGFSVDKTLLTSANTRYHHVLMQQLSPYITGMFEQVLRSDLRQASIPASLYHDLEAYVTWTSAPSKNNTAFMQMLTSMWTELQVPTAQQAILMPHVLALLVNRSGPIAANQHLLSEVRALLLSLPKERVAWMALYSQAMNESPQVNQQLGDSLRLTSVNPLFLPEKSMFIRGNRIPEVLTRLTQPSATLKKTLFSNAQTASDASFIQGVYGYYLQAMSAYWYKQLQTVVLAPASNLAEARLQLHDLAQIDSPVWQWISRLLTVLDESKKTLPHAEFWSQLHAFTVPGKQQSAFRLAGERFDALLAACDSPEATFQKTADRMKHPSEKDTLTVMQSLGSMMPNPLHAWLQSLTQTVWLSMLQRSGDLINTHWQEKVYPFYHQYLEGRYPLDATATKEVNLAHFTAFFGPGGLMQEFFEHNLDPFINTNKKYWTLKQLDGKGLALSQEHLDVVFHSSLIQKMFYQDDRQSPTVMFSLLPLKIAEQLQSVELNIAGQTSIINPQDPESLSSQWPGANGQYAGIKWVTTDKGSSQIMKTGPWAWYRLLDAGKITATPQPNRYWVDWSLGSYTVHFQLTANHVINPYVPGVLSGFGLWPELIDKDDV